MIRSFYNEIEYTVNVMYVASVGQIHQRKLLVVFKNKLITIQNLKGGKVKMTMCLVFL